MTEEHLLEKVLFKLVKKHIAGTKMSSALDKAKELNGKGMPVSLTFLSDAPESRSKAKYITSTYLELIRQVARLHLRASVQVPLEQVGSGVAREVALANLNDIINSGNRYGVFLWLEANQDNLDVATETCTGKGCGIAMDLGTAQGYVAAQKTLKALKIRCEKPGDEQKHRTEVDAIERIAKKTSSLVLTHVHDGVMRHFMKNGNKYRKSLIFEYQLGYSNRRMARLGKRGARLSVYVPFGKDWVSYATTTVPEGYMRFLAGSLLNEQPEKKGI